MCLGSLYDLATLAFNELNLFDTYLPQLRKQSQLLNLKYLLPKPTILVKVLL